MAELNDYVSTTLVEWVVDKCDEWENHYTSNYRSIHEEYYRLWRGQWAKGDSLRDSERSKIITPALQQAVESSVAEVEEATFGRGDWFDIKNDFQDQGDNQRVEFTKRQLTEDMKYSKARSCIGEVLLNAAIFGTGIGELYLSEEKELVPASQPDEELGVTNVGVMERERVLVRLRPIMPKNFRIDPLATSIEDALGCAIDEYVSEHQIQQDIDSGIYLDADVTTVRADHDLEPDSNLSYTPNTGVRLTRYYGLVPRELLEVELESETEEEEIENLSGEVKEQDLSTYVEAIVVIANGDTLLKVERNPYMMEDRPIVAFSWDTVPSLFWGRGVCEKGYNAQKALDTEMRARIDALSLTVHPMMAVDASRLPRGAQLTIRPGKTILTNGNPAEILQPLNFGSVDQITFAQGAALQGMVQQATGAVDTQAYSEAMQGEGTAAGISMSMGAIIKRHKRTLLNFQENFLVPFISKSAYRYMQFEPDLYSAQDYKFVPVGSLGLIAREYEVTQLVQLLQTMPQESPMYNFLTQSIIENMNLTNREEILEGLRASTEPDPAAQEAEQMQQQLQQQLLQLQIAKVQAETEEITTRSAKNLMTTEMMPLQEETRRIEATSRTADSPAEQQDREFSRRIEAAKLALQERSIAVQEAHAKVQEAHAALQLQQVKGVQND